MPSNRISLDSSALAGRLRQTRRSTYERRPIVLQPRLINDVRSSQRGVSAPKPKPAAKPAVQATARHAAKRPVRKRRNLRSAVLMSFAGVLFLFGLGVGFKQLTTNEQVKSQVQAISTQVDQGAAGDTPSETKPAGTGSYRVAHDRPRVLTIDRLDVKARILPVSVKANNEIAAPTNIFDVGWYSGSALPGSDGTMLLDGHVHGPTSPGVFVGLKKLQAGDQISVERGDGQVFSYRVVRSQSYPKDQVDMGAAFNSAEPGKPGLNIITCHGNYDEAGNYDDRLIVFAVQE